MKLKLFFISLLLVGMASAQAPKIKHVYKDKVTFYGSEVEKESEPINYCDYSPTGKLFTEKIYIQASEAVVKEYYYDKKDSITKGVYKGFMFETDSTIYVYSANSDTLQVSDYSKGKKVREVIILFYKNGKKSSVKDFSFTDSSGYVASYDSSGKVISIINNNKAIKYDKFGNTIEHNKYGTTTLMKYSNDGKNLIEEEVIPDDKASSYKSIYSYNSNGKLIKEVYFSNGYMSNKNGKKKMVYSDSSITTYTYNAQNNKTSAYVYGKGTEITRETFYAYDKDNRLIKETYCPTTGLCTQVIIYSYDKYGNILEETHYKGMNGSVLDWKYVYTYEFY